MKKTIVTVFLVIGVLLICALAWDMFFNNNGILSSIWNAVITPINAVFGIILSNNNVIPQWDPSAGTNKTGTTNAW